MIDLNIDDRLKSRITVVGKPDKDNAMTHETHKTQPPRMTITWQVLEAARDAGDEMVIAACRRIIAADKLGWKKHGDPDDLKLIMEFAA